MKHILDPKFKYVPSGSTDIRKTFARIRREMKIPEPPPPSPKVVALRKKK